MYGNQIARFLTPHLSHTEYFEAGPAVLQVKQQVHVTVQLHKDGTLT
jgi:hypothetical protein